MTDRAPRWIVRAPCGPARWLPLLCALMGCAHGGHASGGGSWHIVQTEHVRLRTPLRARPASRVARSLERQVQILTKHTFPCVQDKLRTRVEVTLLPGDLDYERARSEVDRALAADAGCASCQLTLAHVEGVRGHWTAAEAALQRALLLSAEGDKDVWRQVREALAYVRQQASMR